MAHRRHERRAMKYWVYVLYSAGLNRYYTGFSENPDRRIEQHKVAKYGWTSRADDWREVTRFPVDDEGMARKLEHKIKAHGVKRFLQDLTVSTYKRE
jgi:putative endonuclease